MTPIINERNTFTTKGVTFLIVKTSCNDGLWSHDIKNVETGKRKNDIPDHKIRKYLN